MHIDWFALLIVAVVAVAATVVFTVLISFGIRLLSVGRTAVAQGRGSVALGSGYALLAAAGVSVLFCIYLIVPQFH